MLAWSELCSCLTRKSVLQKVVARCQDFDVIEKLKKEADKMISACVFLEKSNCAKCGSMLKELIL